MVQILFLLNFVRILHAAPVQDAVPVRLPAQETIAQDFLEMLANEWVLRERLIKEKDRWQPMATIETLRLVLYQNRTYKLIRQQIAVNAPEGIDAVEWGNWEINKERDLISAQVTNVDGRSIHSTMMYRWQIEKLTPQQLILRKFGFGNQVLVFERAS